MAAHTPQEVNILALVKDGERFVFLFDEESYDELLATLGNYAADPELSFSWYDAAVLSQRVRRIRDEMLDEVIDEESDSTLPMPPLPPQTDRFGKAA